MKRLPFLAVPTLCLLFACGNSSLAPRPVPLDKVNCSGCGMMVSEERYAAEIVFADGDARYYDDLGCLAGDRKVSSARHRAYVRDASGEAWLAADSAFYARPAGLRTPMGHGLAAFPEADQARKNDANGRVLSWNEVCAAASREEKSR